MTGGKGPVDRNRIMVCSYAEAIHKLAKPFKASFGEDQHIIAQTVATIYEANVNEVKRHLKAGTHA